MITFRTRDTDMQPGETWDQPSEINLLFMGFDVKRLAFYRWLVRHEREDAVLGFEGLGHRSVRQPS